MADCDIINQSKELSVQQIEYLKKIIDIYNHAHIKKMFYVDSGTEIKKLGEIVEFVKGKKYNVSDGKDSGLYPLLCSSKTGKVKYLDTYEYENNHIVIGTGGTANVHYYNKFNISTDMRILKCKDIINDRYLYYYLLSNLDLLEELFKGSTIKHLDFEEFKKLQIPVPDVATQEKIVAEFDALYNAIELNKKIIDGYEDKIKYVLQNYL